MGGIVLLDFTARYALLCFRKAFSYKVAAKSELNYEQKVNKRDDHVGQ